MPMQLTGNGLGKLFHFLKECIGVRVEDASGYNFGHWNDDTEVVVTLIGVFFEHLCIVLNNNQFLRMLVAIAACEWQKFNVSLVLVDGFNSANNSNSDI